MRRSGNNQRPRRASWPTTSPRKSMRTSGEAWSWQSLFAAAPEGGQPNLINPISPPKSKTESGNEKLGAIALKPLSAKRLPCVNVKPVKPCSRSISLRSPAFWEGGDEEQMLELAFVNAQRNTAIPALDWGLGRERSRWCDEYRVRSCRGEDGDCEAAWSVKENWLVAEERDICIAVAAFVQDMVDKTVAAEHYCSPNITAERLTSCSPRSNLRVVFSPESSVRIFSNTRRICCARVEETFQPTFECSSAQSDRRARRRARKIGRNEDDPSRPAVALSDKEGITVLGRWSGLWGSKPAPNKDESTTPAPVPSSRLSIQSFALELLAVASAASRPSSQSTEPAELFEEEDTPSIHAPSTVRLLSRSRAPSIPFSGWQGTPRPRPAVSWDSA